MNSSPPSRPSDRSLVRQELKELIEAIGGEGVLLSLLEKFYKKMHDDILVGFFFTGKDLKAIAHMQGQFILSAAGLILQYPGKGPATAHIALPPILSGHFDRRLILLRETLNEAALDPKWIERWLGFEESFRKMIVAD